MINIKSYALFQLVSNWIGDYTYIRSFFNIMRNSFNGCKWTFSAMVYSLQMMWSNIHERTRAYNFVDFCATCSRCFNLYNNILFRLPSTLRWRFPVITGGIAYSDVIFKISGQRKSRSKNKLCIKVEFVHFWCRHWFRWFESDTNFFRNIIRR